MEYRARSPGGTLAKRIDVPPTAFAFTDTGKYLWKADRRDLFQISHPRGWLGEVDRIRRQPD